MTIGFEVKSQTHITEAERIRIQYRVESLLSYIGKPQNRFDEFARRSLLVDRVFTCREIGDLFTSLERLVGGDEEYTSGPLFEVSLIVKLRPNLRQFVAFADRPISPKDASEKSGHDLAPLKDILHRFVDIDVFSMVKIKNRNHYKFESKNFENNRLRERWEWLWAHPYKQISLNDYDDPEFMERISRRRSVEGG